MRTEPWVKGSTEYLELTVLASESLDSQVVEVSFDRDTWYAAEWQGSSGETRDLRILIGDDVPIPNSTETGVFIRITDNPEIPVLYAGLLQIV